MRSPPHIDDASALEKRLGRFTKKSARLPYGEISYYDIGSGVPVVFLHGIGSGSASWLNQFEQISAGFRLIAWDAPGYGDSSPLSEQSPTAIEYAQALHSFFLVLGLTRITIIGHSLGAIMATAYAALWPAEVMNLVLADPANGYGRESKGARDKKLAERLERLSHWGPAELAKQRAPKLLGPCASQGALEIVRWNMARIHPKGYAQAARMLASENLLTQAPEYEGPTLVLCGLEDTITPPRLAQQVHHAFKNAEYKELRDAGHASYVDQPERFNALVTEFIKAKHGSRGQG